MALSLHSVHLFVTVIIIALAISVEGLPSQKKNVVYTRYVNRRPIPNSHNVYIEEVYEVFNTRRRPPPYAFLHDEDLTRFVRCDYNPNLPDCDDGESATVTISPTTTTTASSSLFGFNFGSPSTEATTNRPTKPSTTASSIFGLNFGLPTITTTTSETELGNDDRTSNSETTPALDAESREEEDYGEENETEDDYETETANETDGADDQNADDNTENTTESEVTTEKTTKKSFLNWF